MALNAEITKKINDLVYKRPRTIQEIAKVLGKSWHTAESYAEKIAKDSGTISIITFREGTKGALKIAYWTNAGSMNTSSLQENLFKKIEFNHDKKGFDFLDIYAAIDPKYKKAIMAAASFPKLSESHGFLDFLKAAENSILCFSGNMSWINLIEGDNKLKYAIESLVIKNKINMKVLCRVDLASLNNLKLIDSINKKAGREAIEVRHCRQPLRGFVIDGKIARFKDEKAVSDFRDKELSDDFNIFYEVYDTGWSRWLQDVFWHLFRNSMLAENRVKELEAIKVNLEVNVKETTLTSRITTMALTQSYHLVKTAKKIRFVR